MTATIGAKAVEVREKLVAAIVAARSNGYKIVTGRWGVGMSGTEPQRWDPDGTCLCPMACVLLGKELGRDEQEDVVYDKYADAARELGCTKEQVYSFVEGYDDDGLGGIEPEFFALGAEMRALYAREMP